MILGLTKNSDYVSIVNPTATPTGTKFSLSCWVKYAGNADGYVLGNAESSDIRINPQGRIQFVIFNGAETKILTSPLTYDDVNEHFVVGVRNDQVLELWVDGVKVVTTSFAANNTRSYKIQAIGQRVNNSGYYKGTVRGIGCWSKALSPSEIATLYNSGTFSALSAQTGLVAGYNCTEGTGTAINDVSGNAKHGVLQNPNGVYSNWIDETRTTPATWYVSPAGSKANNGAGSGSAWDLAFGLSHPPAVLPIDTIKLVSGTYAPTAKLTSYLTGNSTNRIVIETDSYKGHFPNVAKINGNGISIGGTILTISGKYATYWDLEVFNSNPARVSAQAGSQPTDIVKLAGVDVVGENIKVNNLHTHDNNGNGLTCFDPTGTVEFLGYVLTYNNGWVGPDRNHGHGIYTHNGNAQSNIKFENVISFNNYEYLIQHYSSQYASDSYNIEFAGLHGSGGSGFQFVGSGPKHNFTLRDVNAHNNLVMGYADEDNYDFLLERAIVQAFGSPVTTRSWRTPKIKDSTIISLTNNLNSALGRIAQVAGALGAGASFTNNAYYAKTGANTNQLMRYETQQGVLLNYWTFANWQANLGLDANSTANITATGKPTTNQLKYYADSQVLGRGVLVVWNWQGSANVAVNLSNFGLVSNQNYKLYDAYNVGAGIIAQGSFNSASPNINVSTASNGVSPKANDAASTEASLAPEFNIFLVIPGNVAVGTPNPPTNPTNPTLPIVRPANQSTILQFNWNLAGGETAVHLEFREVGATSWTRRDLLAGVTFLQETVASQKKYEARVSVSNANGQSPWHSLGEKVTTVVRYFGGTEPTIN